MAWAHVTEKSEEGEPLTSAEQEILEKLQEHIGEEGKKQLTYESQLRYVRGYAFEAKNGGKEKWLEVAKAEADKTIKWRKEFDVNHLEVKSVPKWDIWEKSWPTAVCGTDTHGHPIIVESFKEFNLKELMGNFKAEDIHIYQARNMEGVQRRKALVSKKLDRLVYKHVYIMDCSGMTMDVLKARAQVQAIFHVAQYYYPESLWKLFIVNSPLVFRMIWQASQPFIHPITKAKIKVLSGKGLKELAAGGIPESQIPPSLGGTWKPDPEFEAEIQRQVAELSQEYQSLEASTTPLPSDSA
uniref:CRAL-TRIO domain-containing protein n=1 Tax=Eutreptiella gymnastica TaxID=73025 RepID=A0A7S1J892_9EUGL|mmetsp:Transcript_75107/g.132741  ORF Transcript_75107/g.132741 Transcript_75107/m.132741 type:complete len:298 (+) Transcript_75107:44-937(+)